MHFQRFGRCHQDHGVRPQAGFAAFDVEEFFRAEIGAETRFGNDVVRELQGCLGGDYRITAVCNVGEWATVHQRGIVFQRLHEIRL